MTTIVWARPALEDVREIRAYIAGDSPRYARAVAERIFAAVDRLYEHPLSGRVVPELGQATVREIIAPPYRIVYSCTGCAPRCWRLSRWCTARDSSRATSCREGAGV